MKPKNFVKGVNPKMDSRLGFHNANLKALILNFETVRKLSGIGVKMSMPKVDTLNGDGKFENLDGVGTLVFEYEIKRQMDSEVWIKTRKLRGFIETDIVIQAYEGTDIIRTFTCKDVDKTQRKTVDMWQPSSKSTEPVTSVRVTKFVEHKSIADFVKYIKEVF